MEGRKEGMKEGGTRIISPFVSFLHSSHALLNNVIQVGHVPFLWLKIKESVCVCVCVCVCVLLYLGEAPEQLHTD